MTWREQLQPASIAGVPFLTTRASFTFGRRTQVHEYPLRDVPFAEDHGRKARRFTLECVVLGSDYMAKRDALISVLEQGGSHELVHPYFGLLNVSVEGDCRCTETANKGGKAVISVPVVETGNKTFPTQVVDTRAQAIASVDAARVAQALAFAKTFDVGGQPEFVQNSAIADLNKGLTALRGINGQLSALQTPINQTTAAIDDIGGELATLITQPLALASAVQALTLSLFNTGFELSLAFSCYENLNTAVVPEQLIHDTPEQRQRLQNQQATQKMLAGAGLLTFMQTVVNASDEGQPFDSTQALNATGGQLLEAVEALQAASDDASFAALQQAFLHVSEHLQQKAQGLGRVRYVATGQRQCALVLAHTFYGSASGEADLVRRNNVAHPLFIRSGELEVLGG